MDDDIDEDINSYLDLYNNPGPNPPGGSVGEYRALIEFKIKKLLKQKLIEYKILVKISRNIKI